MKDNESKLDKKKALDIVYLIIDNDKYEYPYVWELVKSVLWSVED